MAIGQLTVGVAANAAKGVSALRGFRKEVAGVKTDCSTASKSVTSFTGGINRVGASLAGAAAGYVSTRAFLSIASDLDTLAKTSAKLDVVPVKLMGLRHAAEQTGVAAQTLDNALSKMTIRAAEAARGGGDAAGVLKELGIDAQKFARLSADQQFVKIAGAMDKQTSQADKLRIATKLFEEEGAALVNTLKLGEQGLVGMTREASKLMGSLTKEDLAKVEQFNDALDRLRKAAGGAGNEIVVSAAPSLTAAADAMTEALQGLKSFKLPDNAVTRNVGAAASYAHDGLAGVYYRNFFGGADDNSAGALTDAEKLAGNKRVGEDVFRHSTKPEDVQQRMVRAANRGNAIRAGQAFSDNTTGLAKKAIGDGMAGLVNLVGDLKGRVDHARYVMRGREASGLNPLTGLQPIQMSEARKAMMSGGSVGRVSDRINSLVDAGGAEGWQALRANQRSARLNPADKSAPKIEQSTKKTADTLAQMLDWFKKGPAPVEV